jgi:hypothetical protein
LTLIDQHESATADAGTLRFDETEHGMRGDRRFDSVTALFQYLDPRSCLRRAWGQLPARTRQSILRSGLRARILRRSFNDHSGCGRKRQYTAFQGDSSVFALDCRARKPAIDEET